MKPILRTFSQRRKNKQSYIILYFCFGKAKINLYLHPLNEGTLAQLVEQRTENPCVPGSIPGGTTKTQVVDLGFLLGEFNTALTVSRRIILYF